MENELSRLRQELNKMKDSGMEKKGYELWHILIAMVLSMIIGNFLGSGSK